MTVEEIDLDDTDALFAYADWAIKTGLWDGRAVSWREATAFRSELEGKVVEMLFTEDSNNCEFQNLVAGLARIDSSLSPRSITALAISPNGQVIQAGLGKSIKKFWKKHKKEIIITAAAVAVVTTVVVVAVCTGGSGAGPTALGGAQALKQLNDHLEAEEEPELAMESPLAPTIGELLDQEELVSPDTFFLEDGVVIDDQFVPYKQIPQGIGQQSFEPHFYPAPKTLPPPSTSPSLEELPEQIDSPSGYQSPSFRNKTSSYFETPGLKQPHLQIGGINGINTTLDQAANHASYLKELSSDQSIHWTHNQTHGLITDVCEVVGLNYLGYSPNTGKFLKEEWTAFHERNLDRPNAKYLHFCHSQGAIHTRNALDNCPPEIKNRVIVIAIAPGAIIPKEACYQAFNYASKKDLVHVGEIAFAGGLNTNEFRDSEAFKMAIEKHDNLILLEPHPDAKGIDHDFQSPTFEPLIEQILSNYIEKNGEYH